MPKPLGKFISSVIPQEHVWKIKLFGHWDEIIGNLKEKVRIEKITNNGITIGVYHATWAQELLLLSPVLKEKINSFLEEEKIKNIQFKTIVQKKRFQKKTKKKIPKQINAPIETQTLTIVEHNQLLRLQSNNPKETELINALEKFCLKCKQSKKKGD